MTSFTKPEVHNLLHCRERRTEQWPNEVWTCALRHTSTQTHRQTRRHTDTKIAILRTPSPVASKITTKSWKSGVRTSSSRQKCSDCFYRENTQNALFMCINDDDTVAYNAEVI